MPSPTPTPAESGDLSHQLEGQVCESEMIQWMKRFKEGREKVLLMTSGT